MTDLLPVPAAGQAAPARRTRPPVHARVVAYTELYDTPPDLQFDAGAGTWCPMCRGMLAVGPAGWACVACLAEWDFRGLHGRWVHTVAQVALPAAAAKRARRSLVDCCMRAGVLGVLLGAVVALVLLVARGWRRLRRHPRAVSTAVELAGGAR